MKEYIEDMETTVDAEWGDCRNVEELIKADMMPDLYYQLTHEKK